MIEIIMIYEIVSYRMKHIHSRVQAALQSNRFKMNIKNQKKHEKENLFGILANEIILEHNGKQLQISKCVKCFKAHNFFIIKLPCCDVDICLSCLVEMERVNDKKCFKCQAKFCLDMEKHLETKKLLVQSCVMVGIL